MVKDRSTQIGYLMQTLFNFKFPTHGKKLTLFEYLKKGILKNKITAPDISPQPEF